MSAASVERPHGNRPLIAEANRIVDRLPGYRVEIIRGTIVVTPPPQRRPRPCVVQVADPLHRRGPRRRRNRGTRGCGCLAAERSRRLCDPGSRGRRRRHRRPSHREQLLRPDRIPSRSGGHLQNDENDLRGKVGAYAQAKIPVYVITNRQHQRVHVLTEPTGGEYQTHRIHAPGETVTLPRSIGAEVTLDVDLILKAGQTKVS